MYHDTVRQYIMIQLDNVSWYSYIMHYDTIIMCIWYNHMMKYLLYHLKWLHQFMGQMKDSLSYQIKFAQRILTKFAPKSRSIRTAGQRLDDLYNL